MNILAVDTSSQTLTVALKTESFYEEINQTTSGMQHSECLMNSILSLCAKAGVTTGELDLLICTRGPGSFTGLRIGMSTLKGISLGSGKPVVSVSTMETFALAAGKSDGLYISVLDARKQRWYLGAFEKCGNELKRVMPDTDGTEDNLSEVLSGAEHAYVAGPDALRFSEILEASYPECKFSVCSDYSKSIAESMIELGLKQYEEKGADDIGQGPVYIRKSDAEIALEERERKNESS